MLYLYYLHKYQLHSAAGDRMNFMEFQWDVVEQFNFLSSHKICLLNFPRDFTKMRVLRHKWDFLLFETPKTYTKYGFICVSCLLLYLPTYMLRKLFKEVVYLSGKKN